MTREWALAEVVLAGEEFRWSLGLLHYEFPNESTGYDGNWLEVEVDLEVDFAGTFTARRKTTVLTTEITAAADELATLLSTGTGSAEIGFLEEETGVVLRATDDNDAEFDVEVYLRVHNTVELRGTELTVSRGAVQSALQQLRQATKTFPVRGNPRD